MKTTSMIGNMVVSMALVFYSIGLPKKNEVSLLPPGYYSFVQLASPSDFF